MSFRVLMKQFLRRRNSHPGRAENLPETIPSSLSIYHLPRCPICCQIQARIQQWSKLMTMTEMEKKSVPFFLHRGTILFSVSKGKSPPSFSPSIPQVFSPPFAPRSPGKQGGSIEGAPCFSSSPPSTILQHRRLPSFPECREFRKNGLAKERCRRKGKRRTDDASSAFRYGV